MEELTLFSPDEAWTFELGRRLGQMAEPGDMLALVGQLGAGKSVLARGAAAGLGISGPVPSPTFTLIREYCGRLPLYHFDLYRLDDPAEIEGLGYEDYFFGNGLTVVEWADRALAWLPRQRLEIVFRPEGEGRRLKLKACGMRFQRLLGELPKRLPGGEDSNC